MATARYQEHGGSYRAIRDLSQPWAPSPLTPAVALPNEVYRCPYDEGWTPPTAPSFKIKLKYFDSRATERNAIVQWVRRIFRLDRLIITHEIPRYHPDELDPPRPRYAPVPHSEWKAWGYYAQPNINGIIVNNQSPPIRPALSLRASDLINLLRSPGGTHPERWIPGIRHPALPPKPSRWTRPDPRTALPFPWECYLNPWLVHDSTGAPPAVKWDVGMHPSLILVHSESPVPVLMLTPADFCQPASFPFLTHMAINALFVNGRVMSWWRVMIVNPDGICCGDVFAGIYENFEQNVSQQEFDSWEMSIRQEADFVSRWRTNNEPLGQNTLRRRDFLGRNCMFNGLSVNPDRHGWVLHVTLSEHIHI